MRLKFNYFVLIFFCSGWTILISSRNVAAKSGPYKTVILNVNNKCDDVMYPYEKVSTGHISIELFNLSNGEQVLRTNITVLRNNRGIMLRVKAYKWENNKWNLVISRNNIGCHSAVFPLLVQQTDLDIDMDRCSVPKGSYILKNLNIDTVDHIMAANREYGKHKWRVEVYMKSATISCFEYITAILPTASSS